MADDGVQMMDQIGPFMATLEKDYPELQSRVFNNGLWYVSTNAKKDMREGKAGDERLAPIKYLRRKFDNKKSNRKWKRKGLRKDQTRLLRRERTADRKSHLRKGKGALPKFAFNTSYRKANNATKASLGWLGAKTLKLQRLGILYQEAGSTNVTSDMRRHFFGLGIGMKKSTRTIKKPSRDIWNNVHQKHVEGGGMQEHMEKQLAKKLADREQKAKENSRKETRVRRTYR